jgi:hypothetical protein
MTSYYTLNNDQIGMLNAPQSQFQVYIAFHDPVSFTESSQDLLNSNGTIYVPPATDLLANKSAPYVPTAIMGPNRIGFVNEPLFFDGALSYQRSGILAWGHQWTATGPSTITTFTTPISFSNIIPAGVSVGNQQCSMVWSAPGNYYVTLTVSDRYGNSFTGTRQVRIYNSRQEALPGTIQISGVSGNIANGGWGLSLTTVASSPGYINPDALPVGTYLPVTLIVETEYQRTPTQTTYRTVGQWGNWSPGQPYKDPRIFFAGYVVKGTAHQDSQYDTLQFDCQTAEMIAQEAQILTVAYYNAQYSTKDTHGRWNTLLQITAQSDQLVGDLTAEDVYRSILTDHVTLTQYHDLIIWNRFMIDPALPDFGTVPTYTSLTMNQGGVWSALQTLTQNEFASLWSERDSSIRIGPLINYRGPDAWGWFNNAPVKGVVAPQNITPTTQQGVWPPALRPGTALGTTFNPTFPPVVSPVGVPIYQPPQTNSAVLYAEAWRLYHLRNEFYSDVLAGKDPYTYVDYQPMNPGWLPFVNDLWGPNLLPLPTPNRSTTNTLICPIVAHFSDMPEWDNQQDISIAPYTIDVQEVYNARSAFVKLIGYKIQHDEAWSASYPLGVFDVQGHQLVRLPVGNFALIDNLVLPDMTTSAGLTMGWNYLWEMARLSYFVLNARYSATITYGISNWVNLHDFIFLTRLKPQKGPTFSQKLFYVTGISYNIDLNTQSWLTQIDLGEVTSNNPILQNPIAPPWPNPNC